MSTTSRKPFIDESGRLFGILNIFDSLAIVAAVLITAGVMAVQSGTHVTSGEMVKGETDIEYTFQIFNAKTLDKELFKVDETLSMTIRNQPRGNVKITKIEAVDKTTVVPSSAAPGYQVIADPADQYGVNFLVTVQDHALITDDGYVTEGVKVKTGMRIKVEGFDYQFPANIVSVRRLEK